MSYRIIKHPNVSQAIANLSPNYQELVDAKRDCGTGLVIDKTNRVIIFHERHLPVLQAGLTPYHL